MRADGIKIKNADAMYRVAAHIMKKRYDAMNMITIDIPLEPIKAYVNKRRRENGPVNHLAILLAAYLRTVSQFPALNRFVVNKQFYARKEIAVGMVVLKGGKIDNHGTMSKMKFELTDTIFDVTNKIKDYVEKNRTDEENNSTEKTIDVLTKIPGLLRFGVPILLWMDKHGFLPQKLIDVSPFHASMSISNLASIRTNHVYHHCYEFGTTSIFMTIGNMREVPKRVNGEIVFERCLPLGIVMDERIASGSYFALAFRQFAKYLENPELLEQPVTEIVPDPGI